MEPSRKLDELIAAKVLGVKCLHYPHGQDYPYYIPSGKPWRTHSIDAKPLLRFSTDWNAAALVVAEMRRCGWQFSLHQMRSGIWEATFEGPRADWCRQGADAPEAICKAALAAVEGGRLPTVDELAAMEKALRQVVSSNEEE